MWRGAGVADLVAVPRLCVYQVVRGLREGTCSRMSSHVLRNNAPSPCPCGKSCYSFNVL